jgi:hypothetical protein
MRILHLVPQASRLRVWLLAYNLRTEHLRRRILRLPRAAVATRLGRARRAAGGLDRLDAIFVVNLAHRSDRLAAFQAEAERLGLAVERFDAIEDSLPIRGCGRSHAELVGRMAERGWDAIMVCEDDARFAAPRRELDLLVDRFLDDPRAEVLCLGYRHEAVLPYDALFLRATATTTTACYVVKASIARDLVALWQEGIEALGGGGDRTAAGVDQIWKRLQPERVFLIPIRRAVFQKSGYSDILGRTVSFRHEGDR